MVAVHEHPLYASKRSVAWYCNGASFGGCRQVGDSTEVNTRKRDRFRCRNCDFDLCGSCLEAHRIASGPPPGLFAPLQGD